MIYFDIILFIIQHKPDIQLNQMQATNKETFKVIIVGSSGVGKSSLLLRFTDNAYETNLLATIGVDFKFKSVKLKEGQNIKLQIWDTAGSESFRAIVSAYYRGANAVIMVYSAIDKGTWNDLKQFWINELNKYKSVDCQIYIFENKMDLVDQYQKSGQDQSTAQEIKQFMEKQGIKHKFQVSAKTGKQVHEAFYKIAEQLHLNSPKVKSQIILEQQIKKQSQNKKSANCCK